MQTMKKDVLAVAVNGDQFMKVLDINTEHDKVVFATLDDRALSRLKNRIDEKQQEDVPVYLYETG